MTGLHEWRFTYETELKREHIKLFSLRLGLSVAEVQNRWVPGQVPPLKGFTHCVSWSEDWGQEGSEHSVCIGWVGKFQRADKEMSGFGGAIKEIKLFWTLGSFYVLQGSCGPAILPRGDLEDQRYLVVEKTLAVWKRKNVGMDKENTEKSLDNEMGAIKLNSYSCVKLFLDWCCRSVWLLF